jgi:hypothetical protein
MRPLAAAGGLNQCKRNGVHRVCPTLTRLLRFSDGAVRWKPSVHGNGPSQGVTGPCVCAVVSGPVAHRPPQQLTTRLLAAKQFWTLVELH